MKFWHPVDNPIVGNFDTDEKIFSTNEGLEVVDGETLSLDVPLCYDIGSSVDEGELDSTMTHPEGTEQNIG